MIRIHKTVIDQVQQKNNLKNTKVTLFQETNRVSDYIIDDTFLLRISNQVLNEVAKLDLVKDVFNTQKVLDAGSIEIDGEKKYYVLMTFFPGQDLYDALSKQDTITRKHLAKQIYHFMSNIHEINGTHYDIGFYIPTIPSFQGTWKQGHEQYCIWLKRHIEDIELKTEVRNTIEQAFQYIDEQIKTLEHQTGPVLLHNDLHPKNMIVQNDILGGVIDFECAQFGERDFELSHLVHWSVFPPDEESYFDDLVQEVIDLFQEEHAIPNLDIRLTMYQLEHEINQLIWNNGDREMERNQRMKSWLNGVITEKYFKSI